MWGAAQPLPFFWGEVSNSDKIEVRMLISTKWLPQRKAFLNFFATDVIAPLGTTSLWEPRQKNKVFPLKQTPSQTCSGDTRGVQKALILDLHYIKIDGFRLKQPESLYNSLYINDVKKFHETS